MKKTVQDVLKQDCVTELIIVDDHSVDGTWDKLEKLRETDVRLRIFRHDVNRGKGAVLQAGFRNANGNVIGIQDTDLEYDPAEYKVLLAPFQSGVADVVYGSRFCGAGAHRVLYFWHYVGSRFLTLLSNMFSGLCLTDMEPCYKF